MTTTWLRLSHGAAPELIYLDLRGNPLTEAGTSALVSHAEPFDDACMRLDDACMRFADAHMCSDYACMHFDDAYMHFDDAHMCFDGACMREAGGVLVLAEAARSP